MGIQLQGFLVFFHGLGVAASQVVDLADVVDNDDIRGGQELRLFHVDGGFVGPPLLDEKPGIPMVGVGQARVQLQGAEVLRFGPLPIAVVGLQGEGQGQMGVRPALVDGQGLGGGFLGLGEDGVGHFPAVIAAEVVGIGQGGLRGDVGVVGPHGAAETVDRQPPLLLLPLRQQGQSLEVEPVGLDRLGGGVGPRPPVGG